MPHDLADGRLDAPRHFVPPSYLDLSEQREDLQCRNLRDRHSGNDKYLDNIVEQEHRAIKRCCAFMAGFKSFANADMTIAGIELAHRIRKRQLNFGRGRSRRRWPLNLLWRSAHS